MGLKSTTALLALVCSFVLVQAASAGPSIDPAIYRKNCRLSWRGSIREAGPGVYKDVYGRKELHASHAVIVFCGYESWAIVYAWTNNKVDKVWIRD